MANSGLKKRFYLKWRMGRNLQRATALHFATTIERDAVNRFGFDRPAIVEPFGLAAREFADLPPRGEFRTAHSELGRRRLVVYLGRLD